MKQPTMVYRYPGSKALGVKHAGEFYDYKVVNGEAEEGEDSELDQALGDGWFTSPAAAKAGEESETGEEMPTREELEAKATELGIEFKSSTRDKTLLKKIEEELAEQED